MFKSILHCVKDDLSLLNSYIGFAFVYKFIPNILIVLKLAVKSEYTVTITGYFRVHLQKSVKSTTWSNSPVDISLDNLSPMSHKDKPAQPSMNELYSNQQQMPPATMGIYGMPQQSMYSMGAAPPMNMGVPMMGVSPQINMLSTNMGQMSMSSNMPPMMAHKGMPSGIMQPRQIGQVQSFGSSGYATFKGIS